MSSIDPSRIAANQTAIGAESGPEYWRSVDHLAGSEELQQYVENEFPSLAHTIDSTNRRQFLRLLGASLALAGITNTGCRRWPVEQVRPHTSRPEGVAPGVDEHYATAIEIDGIATGLLAKSYDGRPIKIEGNPDHPFSLGSADAVAQASVLELYDPDRSRHLIQRDAKPTKRNWQAFTAFANPHFHSLRQRQGDGLAVLCQSSASPTWQRMRDEFKQAFPKAHWFEYQPLHRDHEYEGSREALGRVMRSHYDLQQAKMILSFDADLLASHPAHLKLARDWAVGRRSIDQGRMNQMVIVESGLSITGSVADTRLPLKPSLVEASIAFVAHRLGILANLPTGLSAADIAILENAVEDLKQAGSAGLVAVGASRSPAAHQLAHAINAQLGCVGSCVTYTEEPLANQDGCVDQLAHLSELLRGNVLDTVVIIGGNPIYDAPSDIPLNLRSDDSRPLTSIHLSLHDNETSQACTWHLPAAHFLECWGDGRAWDGTYTLQQPLIMPLFEGKSPIELMGMLSGKPVDNGLPLVRATFDALFSGVTQQDWELALHNGMKSDSAFTLISAPVPTIDRKYAPVEANADWEMQFIADAKVYDGRFANSAWLQELPDPLTKLTWDNAARISPSDADRLGIKTGDVVRIAVASEQDGDRVSVDIPIDVMPGHASSCITLPLGYGRRQAGHIGNGVGVDVYPIRRQSSCYVAIDCKVTKTGEHRKLVSTQEHFLLDAVAESAKKLRLGERGKPGMLVHETSLSDFLADQHSIHGDAHAVHATPLFDPPSQFDSPHQWGMSIDLNACIGCSGCVVACQAENNIPVVGKANVAVNREMHWLRIDRYFKGDINQPDVVHFPMACAHCENAPCEQVCPVAATVHDSEGLNSMVYNRCIGTRYCANNCPLKVRRFNYFDFHASDPRTPAKPWVGIPDQQQTEDVSTLTRMVHNPEVTVRMRGVMEKCTYCVQRIVDARITAKNEHSRGLRESDLVAEGEMQTACQATCPTQAIVFGDLNDPDSAVSKAKRNARHYELLDGLNLGARTTYLGKIRNRES